MKLLWAAIKSVNCFFRTIVSYILFIGVCCIFLIPALIILLILPTERARDSKVLFWFFDMAYRGALFATLVPTEIEGKQHLPVTPAIFVANHQSALDIPCVGFIMHGYPHIWFALEYYAQKPVLGFFIRKIGVSIDRDDARKAAVSLLRAIKLVEGENRHFIIFPEGRRYTDGMVHEFLSGFAIVARKTARPVIPVYLPTTGEIYPPGALYCRTKPLKIVIGEPLYYTHNETIEDFTNRTRQWFLEQQRA